MISSGRTARWRRWTVSRVLLLLAGVLLVLLVLPSSWTAPLKGLVQPLVPFQRAARSVVESVAPYADDLPSTIRSEELRELIESRRRYEALAAALALRVSQLEEDNAILLATRAEVVGTQGELIPAMLLGEDPARWRKSVLLDRGTSAGVDRGAAVTTAPTFLDAGASAGVDAPMAVLRGESLIGVVEQVHTFAARVRLVTDPRTQLKVRLVRLDPESPDAAEPVPGTVRDALYWLVGAGDAGMLIREVVRADVENGAIRVGDMVVALPVDRTLPGPATVGRVARIEPDLAHPLLVTLVVHPLVPLEAQRRVYVFKPS